MDLTKLEWKKVKPENEMAAYTATGKRGAVYTLIRNAHHPHQLFAVSGSMRVLPGWYTDRSFEKDGKIRKLA